MALKFLSSHGGGSGTSSSVKYFDIRLDNDYIVFRGNEDEAASAQLAGSVVLCLTEALSVTHVELTLSGIVHMSWQTTSTSSMSGKRTANKERTFFEKSWTFKGNSRNRNVDVLLPDNYEWPFDCILEGALPESVEGLKDAWVIYRLKAVIGRKRARDIIVRKPLRIVRTLNSSALELAHAMSVENIWPNKIQYSITIPSKAVVFGSFLQVDFKLVSLLKGLAIGQVTIQLKEEQEFVVDPEWGISAFAGGQTKTDRVIGVDVYTIDPETDAQIIDEQAEGYQFTRYLELPKTLNKCLQDCNVKGIKIRHKVKFNVQLHNPDGHISELRANLPVSLYISPNLPINENNDLVDQSPQAGRAAAENDITHSAPPLYGEHTLDRLYSGVDPSGYLTPGRVLSNPGTPYLHSRNTSSDNLASLNAVTASGGLNTPEGSSVSPAALQYRLQNLHVSVPSQLGREDFDLQVHPASNEMSRSSSHHNMTDDYFNSHDSSNTNTHPRISPQELAPSGTSTEHGSNAISRRASEEEEEYLYGTRTPFVQYNHMEDLAKVPSYSTAVKTPLPRDTAYGSSRDLPSYGAVMRNPSPPPLAEPPSAHLRDNSRQRGVAGSPETTTNGGTPAMNRQLGILQDNERRLRLMQQRGR